MIEILACHSHEENYTQISSIKVDIEDLVEKKRIERIIKQNNLIGSLEYPDRDYQRRVAELLGVDEGLISVDIDEIDVYPE